MLHPPVEATTTYTCETSYCYYCYVSAELETSNAYSLPSVAGDAVLSGSRFR
jgi:hypothetical protein